MTLDFSLYEILWGGLYAVILGAFFGFLYDFIRLIRVLLGTVYQGKFMKGPFARKSSFIEKKISLFKEKHRFYRIALKWLDAAFDFLYCVFCGVCYAIFLYAVNEGIFRFVFLLGTVAGFCLYRKTVGRLFFFLLREIAAVCYLLIFSLMKILRFLVVRPLKWLILCIFFPFYRKILLLFCKKYDIMNKNKGI